MKKSQLWSSIIEVMIVLMIIVVGIVGTYQIFSQSQKFAQSTENRIQAISIAREWIEALTNIRDTNWLLYSANTQNCWFTLNYDSSCITTTGKYPPAGSYIVYKDANNRWQLISKPSGNFSSATYRNDFTVYLDTNGLYNQTGSTRTNPAFTREIKISYPDTIPYQKANIESVVSWTDASKENGNLEIKLQTTLTNWKKD